MKLRPLTAATAAALILSLAAGVGIAQTSQPAKPATTATQAAPADKGTVSYSFGFSLGAELARTGEQFDIATVVRGVQDAYAKKTPAYTEQQMEAAYSGFQKQMQAKAEAEFKRALADNQTKTPEFLTKYKAQQGVVTLPSGIMYRVVQAGTGSKAAAASQVEIAFQSFRPHRRPDERRAAAPAFKVSEAPIQALRENAAADAERRCMGSGAATGQGSDRSGQRQVRQPGDRDAIQVAGYQVTHRRGRAWRGRL